MLHTLGSMPANVCPQAHIILQDIGSLELAAVMSFDNTFSNEINPQHIIVSCSGNDQHVSIPTISKLWELLTYPLLFPHSTLGWSLVANTIQKAGNQPSSVQ